MLAGRFFHIDFGYAFGRRTLVPGIGILFVCAIIMPTDSPARSKTLTRFINKPSMQWIEVNPNPACTQAPEFPVCIHQRDADRHARSQSRHGCGVRGEFFVSMDGWMDGWMQITRRLSVCCLYVCMHVCVSNPASILIMALICVLCYAP